MAKAAYAQLALGLSFFFVARAFSDTPTRYTVGRVNGVMWFKDSQGKPFFSYGVCVVDSGTKSESYDRTNPSYAAWRFYPSLAEWAKGAVATLRSGGFNTIGAWSNYSDLLAVPNNDLKFTPILHSGSSAGFPWTDMWDPALVKVSDDVTKGLIESLKRDSRIVGYFSDNELGWWRAGLWEWIWKQKTHFTRSRVIALLKKRYDGSWQKLCADFDPGDVTGWDELEIRGRLCLKPGASGQPAIAAVQGMLAERYYRLCKQEIKKYDPGALYLGDRYISNYYPEVAVEAGKYCDVVSTNLNPNWGDGGFVHYHMNGLEKLTHRPLMVTEYYMCATENRSGDKNDRSGFPVVKTLEDRAGGFYTTTTDLLDNPNVVGAHWFQYYDEPPNGRGDGEDYNFGLVDVNNEPYTELLAASKGLDLEAAHSVSARPHYVFAKEAVAERESSFVLAVTDIPRGDLYAKVSPAGVNVQLLWAEDRFSQSFYRNGKVPDGDKTKVEIYIPATKTHWSRVIDPITSTLASDPWHSISKYDTASTLTVTIPARAFAQMNVGPRGAGVDFKVTLTSQTKAYTTVWNVHQTLDPAETQ
jgi:hypothetical protein